MYHIKLIRGRSYMGNGIRATYLKPDVYLENEAVAQKAVASGHFVLIEVTDDEKVSGGNGGGGAGNTEPKNLDKMTTAELTAYATERDIDLTGCKTNAERIAKIRAAEAAKTGGGSDDDPINQFVGSEGGSASE